MGTCLSSGSCHILGISPDSLIAQFSLHWFRVRPPPPILWWRLFRCWVPYWILLCRPSSWLPVHIMPSVFCFILRVPSLRHYEDRTITCRICLGWVLIKMPGPYRPLWWHYLLLTPRRLSGCSGPLAWIPWGNFQSLADGFIWPLRR